MRLKSPFENTRFPLFQNVNIDFFCLKYEQPAIFLNTFCRIMEREECRKFRVCFDATMKKSMSSISYRPYSLDGNDEIIGKCKFIERNVSLLIFLSFIFNYQFWQCLWNSWILILTFPKQQTATEGILEKCSEK